MSVKCPVEIFEQFTKGCGGWVRPDRGGQQFLYDALGEDFYFAGVTPLKIPEFDNETFGNWQKFEHWCEKIELKLMWAIVDDNEKDFEIAFEKFSPKRYFGSKAFAKKKIIDAICGGKLAGVESVMYVEVYCGKKKLFLIYIGQDRWTLGHGDRVLVLKSLSQLSKKNGFYPLM